MKRTTKKSASLGEITFNILVSIVTQTLTNYADSISNLHTWRSAFRELNMPYYRCIIIIFFLEKRNWFSDECNSIFIAFEYFHHVNSVCWCSFLCSTEWLYISSFTTLAAALNPFNLINRFVWFALVYSLIYHIWYCYYSLSPSSSTSLIIALLSHDMINIVWYVLSCNFRQLLLIPFSFHSFIIVSLETMRKLIHPMIKFSASNFIEYFAFWFGSRFKNRLTFK